MLALLHRLLDVCYEGKTGYVSTPPQFTCHPKHSVMADTTKGSVATSILRDMLVEFTRGQFDVTFSLDFDKLVTVPKKQCKPRRGPYHCLQK